MSTAVVKRVRANKIRSMLDESTSRKRSMLDESKSVEVDKHTALMAQYLDLLVAEDPTCEDCDVFIRTCNALGKSSEDAERDFEIIREAEQLAITIAGEAEAVALVAKLQVDFAEKTKIHDAAEVMFSGSPQPLHPGASADELANYRKTRSPRVEAFSRAREDSQAVSVQLQEARATLGDYGVARRRLAKLKSEHPKLITKVTAEEADAASRSAKVEEELIGAE